MISESKTPTQSSTFAFVFAHIIVNTQNALTHHHHFPCTKRLWYTHILWNSHRPILDHLNYTKSRYPHTLHTYIWELFLALRQDYPVLCDWICVLLCVWVNGMQMVILCMRWSFWCSQPSHKFLETNSVIYMNRYVCEIIELHCLQIVS